MKSKTTDIRALCDSYVMAARAWGRAVHAKKPNAVKQKKLQRATKVAFNKLMKCFIYKTNPTPK